MSNGSDSMRASMGLDTPSVAIVNHFDGFPGGINEYDRQYGTNKRIQPGDTIRRVIKLHLETGHHAAPARPSVMSAIKSSGAAR